MWTRQNSIGKYLGPYTRVQLYRLGAAGLTFGRRAMFDSMQGQHKVTSSLHDSALLLRCSEVLQISLLCDCMLHSGHILTSEHQRKQRQSRPVKPLITISSLVTVNNLININIIIIVLVIIVITSSSNNIVVATFVNYHDDRDCKRNRSWSSVISDFRSDQKSSKRPGFGPG